MIKVMTMNIMGYEDRYGPWPVRIGLIREAIEDAQPDIIALQAVRMDPRVYSGKDQATQLASLFPDYRSVIFQPATRYAEGVVDGTAIIARYPIIQTDVLPLHLRPESEDTQTRVLLHARVDCEDGPLHVYNGYFSWVYEQTRENLAEVIPYLKRFDGPGLLVGDFNTAPDSNLLDPLREAGWTDVWAEIYPEEDGFTFFEGNNLLKRIDYAWVNAALKPAVTGIQIVARRETAITARPSNHTGLLVTLSLNP